MRVSRSIKKAAYLSLLVQLLLCLCVSRGEGLHLHPFDSSVQNAESAPALGSGLTRYLLGADTTRVAVSKDSNKRLESDICPASAAVPGPNVRPAHVAFSAPSVLAAEPPVFADKFSATASSDRAPPRS